MNQHSHTYKTYQSIILPQLAFVVVVFLLSPIFAQTTLSGNIGGMTFDKTGNPYLVTETITIQNGKTATIKPGCIFLFKPFTGIDVRGMFFISGTRDTPVVFTSLNDINYNRESEQAPAPFDWNGITIGKDSKKVHLSNFMLAYSVYGIKALQGNLRIDNGIFLQNGQFNFTINDKIQPVKDGFSYSYIATDNKPGNDFLVPRNITKITTAALGITCIATSIPFLIDAQNANKKSNTEHLQTEIDHYRHEERRALRQSAYFALPGVCMLGITVVLSLFDIHKPDCSVKKTTVFYSIEHTQELAITIGF